MLDVCIDKRGMRRTLNQLASEGWMSELDRAAFKLRMTLMSRYICLTANDDSSHPLNCGAWAYSLQEICMKEHEKRIREALEAHQHMLRCGHSHSYALDMALRYISMPDDLRALLADLDAVRGALRHADRTLKNWIELFPDSKDALDTIAIEAIDAALKAAEA